MKQRIIFTREHTRLNSELAAILGVSIGIAVVLLLTGVLSGCLPWPITPTSVSKDAVTLSYNTLNNPWPTVVAKAEELCNSKVQLRYKQGGVAAFECEK